MSALFLTKNGASAPHMETKMKRSYHVWRSAPITRPDSQWKGGQSCFVIASFDTYEQAKMFAKNRYELAENDIEFQINHMGSIVWGPYVKGSERYKP